MEINKYKYAWTDGELHHCPRCGSGVEWTNSRDLDVLESSVHCLGCDLNTFRVETIAFIGLPNLDYETTKMKYNAWCETKPTMYCEEEWVHYMEVKDD